MVENQGDPSDGQANEIMIASRRSPVSIRTIPLELGGNVAVCQLTALVCRKLG
jgi:hypothetical protein